MGMSNKQYRKELRDLLMTKTYQLHITIQPRYYDGWNDDEVMNTVERVEYDLCRQFLKGRWEKFCYEDRFWGIGFWEKEKNTSHRHAHILFHIPYQMMMISDNNDWLDFRVINSFRTQWFSHYPRDRITRLNYERAQRRYGNYEPLRLMFPYIQRIRSDKKDKRKVTYYDTKELFRDDRLEEYFFTRSHRATVSRSN